MAKDRPAAKIKKAIREMSNEELGREMKINVNRFVDPGGNLSLHILLASRSLVACLHLTKVGSSLSQELRDQHINGKYVGDFKITVERIDK